MIRFEGNGVERADGKGFGGPAALGERENGAVALWLTWIIRDEAVNKIQEHNLFQ